jgi:hypothetical protein
MPSARPPISRYPFSSRQPASTPSSTVPLTVICRVESVGAGLAGAGLTGDGPVGAVRRLDGMGAVILGVPGVSSPPQAPTSRQATTATAAARTRFIPMGRYAAGRRSSGTVGVVVTVEDIRRVALSLPRTEEALVRDRVKFRVGRIVYAALSRDETTMGFGFPKEERAALIAAEPEKFFPPDRSDERYNWVQARLAALDESEMRELVIDAWRMCVPKKVAASLEQ